MDVRPLTPISIRKARPPEHQLTQHLVQTVVDEIYGGVWADPPLSIGQEDYSLAWVAISQSTILGMALTHTDSVDDLWVLAPYRSQGVGRLLLRHAEAEIAARNYPVFHLRVAKSNQAAIAFYERNGWAVHREFPHETLPIVMLEMGKAAPEKRSNQEPS